MVCAHCVQCGERAWKAFHSPITNIRIYAPRLVSRVRCGCLFGPPDQSHCETRTASASRVGTLKTGTLKSCAVESSQS